jgi:serine/threonine-protein kinase
MAADAEITVKPGDVLAGKYRVERVLGKGGMGVVVAAKHEQLGFHVALKFMLPKGFHDAAANERFLREARAAGMLRSEHVARVMDFGTLDDGAPYIVMEFLEGSDLQGLLEREQGVPANEAVEYVIQACKGMDEAHAQGIVHRDLKPQNLFLTRRPDGTALVKVLDFGISKIVGPDAQSLSMTASSAMMGSPLYMAPEQIRSSKSVDARADIYSLGVILYQLLTGRLPIVAETLGELFEHVFMKTIPPLRTHAPDITPELEAVVMRCLEKEPENRFASAKDLAAALLPFTDARRSLSSLGAGKLAVSATSAAAPAEVPVGSSTTLGHAAAVSERRPASSPPPGRSRVALWAGGAVVLAVLAAGVVVVQTRASSDAAAHAEPALSAGAAPAVALPSASTSSTLVELPAPSSASVTAPAVSATPGAAAPSAGASTASASASTPAARTSAAAASSPLPAASARPRAVVSPGAAAPKSARPSAKPAAKPADPFGSPD